LYQAFYHLRENPFCLSPDPSFMCLTAQHQEALSGLIYSVCARSSLTVLLGEAGTGKTTILYSLLELLENRKFVTALCTNPTLNREEFYDLLMMKFGVECSSSLKNRQLTALENVLRRNWADGHPCVLIVDEAQRLPADLLEEIRLLLNLETPKEKLLDIIIAGQPELGDILRRPELRQLKQRVSSICRLRSLSRDELKEYIDHRLTRAGLPNQKLFSESVIQQIYAYTGGIPRLVNSLCDGALQTGFALQSQVITAEIIQEVAKDLDLTLLRLEEDNTPLIESDSETAMITGGTSRTPAVSRSDGHLKSLAKPVLVNGIIPNRNTNPPQNDDRVRDEEKSDHKSLGFFAGLMDRLKISNG
jgi:general secretion pathway protein A